jgi:hypothetical protein
MFYTQLKLIYESYSYMQLVQAKCCIMSAINLSSTYLVCVVKCFLYVHSWVKYINFSLWINILLHRNIVTHDRQVKAINF